MITCSRRLRYAFIDTKSAPHRICIYSSLYILLCCFLNMHIHTHTYTHTYTYAHASTHIHARTITGINLQDGPVKPYVLNNVTVFFIYLKCAYVCVCVYVCMCVPVRVCACVYQSCRND